MKLLFIPSPSGGLAHLIPLLALRRLVVDDSWQSAFLLPQHMHGLVKEMGYEVLNLDHQPFGSSGFRSEMRACHTFAPDVLIDDCGLTTGFTASLMHIARVTIQRTGIFPGGVARNPRHRHSLNLSDNDLRHLPDLTVMGLKQPTKMSDLFEAEAKIVPGVASIEVLPSALVGDASYYFSGPLLLEDYLAEPTSRADSVGASEKPAIRVPQLKSVENLRPVQEFLSNNQQRRRVYVTLGTEAKPTDAVRECICWMLDQGMAVITNVPLDTPGAAAQGHFHYAPYLPMHTICSTVDLMVHQCGSGTYQYSLLHCVPSITIGTQCYDREDVALTLEEAGVSVHIPDPREQANFAAALQGAVQRYFAQDEAGLKQAKARLKVLKREVDDTVAEFDFEKVVRSAVSAHFLGRKNPSMSRVSGTP